MAGDWIKMRGNLWDDPRVSRICDLTDSGEAPVVGGLYWLWATADQHTEDGILPGLTLRAIDRKTGIAGFAAALIEIGWLAEHPDGVCITRFEEHNGASAKRRSLDAQRKANDRKVSAPDADKERTEGGQIAPTCGAREEKRREEEKEEPSGSSGAAKRTPRATKRCPDSFRVDTDLVEWAAHNAPAVDIALETAKFRDYTFRSSRSDWPGTWRNWMRKAQEDRQQQRAPPSQTFAQRDAADKAERVRQMTGGLMGGQPRDLMTIDMEAPDAPLALR